MLHLILLLQISAPSAPVDMAVELLDPLKEYQESLIVAGDVRVVDGTEILSLHGSNSERVLGVPRLVESTKGTVLTLKLVQTYQTAALVLEFLEKYGTVPEEMPPEPEAWPTDDDEWAMQRERMH